MSRRKGRQTETAYLTWTEAEILAALQDPNTPKAERQRLLRHAKAIGLRNVRKRRKP